MRAEASDGQFVLQLREGISTDLIALLELGELDFVLGCELDGSPSFELIDLMEEKLLYVTSGQENESREDIKLSDVLNSNLAFLSEKTACWRLLLGAAAAAGFPTPNARKVESLNALRQMVVRGKAAIVATYGAFREECLRGEVGVRSIGDARIVRRLSLTWGAGRKLDCDDERFIGFVFELVSLLQCRTGGYSRMLIDDPRV